MKRVFAYIALTILALLAGVNETARCDALRPNIVIVLADDMGYGDPGCYNSESKVPTPSIDRLASQGMRFTDAHAPASWCTPSRYGLLTGRYPWRSRRKIQQGVIEPGRLTIARFLGGQGYQSACIGKWHLGFDESAARRDFSKLFTGGPRSHGFGYFFGMHASLDIPPYYWIENEKCVAAPTDDIGDNNTDGVTPIQGAFWRGGKIAPGFRHADVLKTITDISVDFINRQSELESPDPFLLYVPLTAPHTPWLPDDAFVGKSRAGMYGDFTHQVDAVLGRILAALDEAKVAENTIVVFSSDNGPVWYPQDVEQYGHHSTGPLRGMKIDMWEGGHRVPFIIRWPSQVRPGSVSDQLVCFTDLLATFAEMTKQALPEGAGEDSQSFLSVLQGSTSAAPLRDTLVIEGRLIRQGNWKLIRGNPNGGLSRFAEPKPTPPASRVVLYNLAEDPGETTDVSADHADRVAAMSAQLDLIRGQQ